MFSMVIRFISHRIPSLCEKVEIYKSRNALSPGQVPIRFVMWDVIVFSCNTTFSKVYNHICMLRRALWQNHAGVRSSKAGGLRTRA